MITWRERRTGGLRAAYCGRCRVGYVARGDAGRDWIWELSLLRPLGNRYVGRESDESAAMSALERAFNEWLGEADLTEKENIP